MMAVPQVAEAAPPSGTDFQIQYWTTNSDGSRGRQMTANDLRGYVNKARCECGQDVSTRVRLSATEARDSVSIRTYIGNNCDTAQTSTNNPQARPCVLAINDFTNTYTRNIDFEFNPLWLATGVSRDSSSRDPEMATAARGCEDQVGDGGIWICVEDGDQTDCQPGEFVTTGAQTQVTDAQGNTPALSYDFRPPTVNATNFRAQGGDGSVVIKWDNSTTTDIQGYRALCANADGSPVDGKGFNLSSVTAQVTGTIYYTADNLCPDGPFDQLDVTDDPTTDDSGGSTGGSGGIGGIGDTDTDGGSTSAAGFGAEPDVSLGGDCCGVGACSDTSCLAAVGADRGSCLNDWDDTCAAMALDYCAICGGAGNCCAENQSANCFDQACSITICVDEGMSSCCSNRWDADCANRAKEVCMDVCGEGTTGGDPTTGTDAGTASSSSTSTSGTTTGGTDTDTGGLDGYDTSGIQSLDWSYVCSGYVAANASSARINGLTNDQEYQVMLVAFDYAGNPVAASDVFLATPRETTDLWEQCDAQGEACGKGGFCSVDTSPRREGSGWLLLTGLFGLFARRRRSLRIQRGRA